MTTPNLRLIRPGEPAPARPADEPPRLRTAWTAAELMAEDFPPPGGRSPG